jgi:molecular chaperone DnaK (HSP70)
MCASSSLSNERLCCRVAAQQPHTTFYSTKRLIGRRIKDVKRSAPKVSWRTGCLHPLHRRAHSPSGTAMLIAMQHSDAEDLPTAACILGGWRCGGSSGPGVQCGAVRLVHRVSAIGTSSAAVAAAQVHCTADAKGGRQYLTAGHLRPEEVGAHVLRHLLAAAEADLGAPIRRAVISASVWRAKLHIWHATYHPCAAL